jgi:hypothetical protein
VIPDQENNIEVRYNLFWYCILRLLKIFLTESSKLCTLVEVLDMMYPYCKFYRPGGCRDEGMLLGMQVKMLW